MGDCPETPDAPHSPSDRAARILFCVFTALLCIVGWGKLEIGQTSRLHLSIGGNATGAFYLLLAAYVAARIMARDIDSRRTGWLREPFVWLCIVALVSPAWNTPDPSWPVRPRDRAEVLDLIAPALTVWLVARYLLDRAFDTFALPVLRALVVALTLVSLQMIVTSPHALLDFGQIDSAYEHHTHVAMRMLMALPLTIGLLLHDRRAASAPMRLPAGYFYGVLLVLQIVGLGLAGSRIGWITLAAVGAYGAVYGASARMRRLFVLAAVGVLVLALAFPKVRGSLLTLQHLPQEENFQRRVAIYHADLALIARHPWLGLGWSSRTFLYAGRAIEGETWEYFHPHNLYLQIPVYLGLPGTLCLLALLASIVGALRRLGRDTPPDMAPLLFGVKSALLGLAVMNIAETVFSSERVTFLTPVLLAFVASWSSGALPAAEGGPQTPAAQPVADAHPTP